MVVYGILLHINEVDGFSLMGPSENVAPITKHGDLWSLGKLNTPHV
jgi:hypothetical protein